MPTPSFRQIAPGRLEVREGGGCIAVFGLPFLGGGIFALLGAAGIIPIQNAASAPSYMSPMLLFMGLAFAMVGGVLVFGRTWTTISSVDRTVVKRMGLLVPMTSKTSRVDDYTGVTLEFIRGDSDTSDQYPVSLRARSGPNLKLCSSTNYAEARVRAIAVAELLHFDIDDSSTGRAFRMTPAQADQSFQLRRQLEHQRDEPVARPVSMRSSVDERSGTVTITIPVRRAPVVLFAFYVIPIAVAVVLFDPFSRFFRQSNTPDVVSWSFLGVLVFAFGVLPAWSALNAFVKSRRGCTIVTVSPAGIRMEERGAWKTRTRASFSASEILDVDCSAAAPPVGEAAERVVKVVRMLVGTGGIVIRTRKGLTTFGEGLEGQELQYLQNVVRRALVQ